MWILYLVITPLGSVGSNHETYKDWGELTTTLISAGASALQKYGPLSVASTERICNSADTPSGVASCFTDILRRIYLQFYQRLKTFLNYKVYITYPLLSSKQYWEWVHLGPDSATLCADCVQHLHRWAPRSNVAVLNLHQHVKY
ncbi:hypothetical protein GQX74_002739 [Glossina fuscipes]|nr:hypothetical protein GQX74_002739 [Glossina fuscipes]